MDSIKGKIVGLIHGGETPEGQVSTLTAKAVQNVLSANGYLTQLINYKIGNLIDNLKSVDLVFNCLHGEFGEDGQLQLILENLGIPFTGSDSVSSELCRDKVKCKTFLLEYDILTPRFISNHKDAKDTIVHQDIQFLLKKRKSGGGIGIDIVNGLRDLDVSFDEYFIEEFIKGTILTVGIIEKDGDTVASPPVEVILPEGKDLYDFDSKVNCKAQFRTFSNELMSHKISKLAEKIHDRTGCRGFSRIDFILSNNDVYFLEINTIPSFFNGSSYRYSMELLGLSMSETCEMIIKSSLVRYNELCYPN